MSARPRLARPPAGSAADRPVVESVLAREASLIAHTDVDAKGLSERISAGRRRPVPDVIAGARFDRNRLRRSAELEKQVGLRRVLGPDGRDEGRAHEQHRDTRGRSRCVHATPLTRSSLRRRARAVTYSRGAVTFVALPGFQRVLHGRSWGHQTTDPIDLACRGGTLVRVGCHADRSLSIGWPQRRALTLVARALKISEAGQRSLRALGMRPLQAHCHLGLGMLCTRSGQQEQARAHLSAAVDLYRAMEMTFWLPQAESELPS